MSTPLVILASILAFFALILIPLMMFKGDRQQHQDQQQARDKQGRKSNRKKRKR